MYRSISVLVLALFCAHSQAASKRVTCNIHSLDDAELCMQKVADTRPHFEKANEGYATADVNALAKALDHLGLKQKTIKRAKGAYFAGIMIENGDEYHIYYFAMKAGKNVSPEQLYDLNVVDLAREVEEPYTVEALDPATYVLGIEYAKVSNVYNDADERLRDLRDEKP